MADIALFGESAVRREILRTCFARPGIVWHVRELARELSWSSMIVGQELDRLERTGILTSERIGRARRYRVDEQSPIATEIRSLVRKTIGVEARIRDAIVISQGSRKRSCMARTRAATIGQPAIWTSSSSAPSTKSG